MKIILILFMVFTVNYAFSQDSLPKKDFFVGVSTGLQYFPHFGYHFRSTNSAYGSSISLNYKLFTVGYRFDRRNEISLSYGESEFQYKFHEILPLINGTFINNDGYDFKTNNFLLISYQHFISNQYYGGLQLGFLDSKNDFVGGAFVGHKTKITNMIDLNIEFNYMIMVYSVDIGKDESSSAISFKFGLDYNF